MINTEEALVVSVLAKNSILADVDSIVRPGEFKSDNLREIYTFILSRWKDNQKTDLILVHEKFGIKHIERLFDGEIPLPSMASTYASEIAETAKKARLTSGIEGVTLDKGLSSAEIISKVSNIVVSETSRNSDLSDAGTCVKGYRKLLASGGVNGISTGYIGLDNLDIEIIRGDYWVIGADTSVGKTSLAINILCSTLLDFDAKVCLISTEMTRDQLVTRVVSYLTDIPGITIFKGRATKAEKIRIEKALSWLEKKMLFITDKTYDISDMENKIRGLAMKHNLDYFIVDYLQHCRSTEYKTKYDILTNVSNRLQELATVTNTGCLALSQISNEVAKNVKGKTKFKGSGDIDGDCDVGIILEPNSREGSRNIRLHVKKNRHGPKGSFDVSYNQNYSKIVEGSYL